MSIGVGTIVAAMIVAGTAPVVGEMLPGRPKNVLSRCRPPGGLPELGFVGIEEFTTGAPGTGTLRIRFMENRIRHQGRHRYA